ncbi:hypothetical protein BKA62DRAFT_708368 [Auriculariales sp. MPI-PUGE-AT-0066]|nr:hypothetical protein BKA62DRAFT_708368 [Auriculariales sp. MPI-PUGE-AT-0066]
MCFFRRVRNTFVACGHQYDLPEEHVDCGNENCRFSEEHDARCVEPYCRQNGCIQYHTHPQVYLPQINRQCPRCAP